MYGAYGYAKHLENFKWYPVPEGKSELNYVHELMIKIPDGNFVYWYGNWVNLNERIGNNGY